MQYLPERFKGFWEFAHEVRQCKWKTPVLAKDYKLSSGGTNRYRKHNPRLVELAASQAREGRLSRPDRKHNPRLVELAALAENALGNKTLA
jgi:hypothetical protein